MTTRHLLLSAFTTDESIMMFRSLLTPELLLVLLVPLALMLSLATAAIHTWQKVR